MFGAGEGLTKDMRHKEMTLDELRAMAIAKRDRDQLLMLLMVEAKAKGFRPGWVLHRVHQEIGDVPFPASWWRGHVTGRKGAWRWANPS